MKVCWLVVIRVIQDSKGIILKKLFCLLFLLNLTGCDDPVTNTSIALAEHNCINHKGIHYIKPHQTSFHDIVVCQDRVEIKYQVRTKNGGDISYSDIKLK